MLSEIQREIAIRVIAGRCTLFVGAGLSMGAGLPSWQRLIETLREELRCPDAYDFPIFGKS